MNTERPYSWSLTLAGMCLQLWCMAQSGTTLFRTDTVHTISVTIPQPDWYNTLVQWHYDDVDSCLMCSVTVDGQTIDSVGINMRGNASFTWSEAPKKPFQLDFNAFVAGQRWDGVKSFNLNTGVPDAAYLREPLTYKVLRDFDVVAPRTGYADLVVNDTLYGLYILVERVNKTFLEDHYASNDGDLWKAMLCDWSYHGVDSAEYYMDPKERADQLNWHRFTELLRVLNETPYPDLDDSLALRLDLTSVLRTFAVNAAVFAQDNLLQNWFLYREPDSARFHYIPWDYNLAMAGADMYTLSEDTTSFFGWWGSTQLMKAVMTNTTLRAQYYDELCTLRADVWNTTHLAGFVQQSHDLLQPHVLADTMDAVSPTQFDSSYFALTSTWGILHTIELQGLYIDDALATAGIACGAQAVPEPAVNHELILFPDPVADAFNMDLPAGTWLINVVDVLGRVVLSRTCTVGEALVPVEVSALEPGRYIVLASASNGERRLVRSFIKH